VFYLTHVPDSPQNEFIDYLWLVASGQSSRKERILPSGTVELVVNLSEDEIRIHDPARPDEYKRFSGAVISGTYTEPFACDGAQHKLMLDVHFKPGGAFPFLGVLASELAGAHANLVDLWGPSAVQLRERLGCATTARERFRIAEGFLAKRLCRRVMRHSAVTTALGLFGPAGIDMSIREVAAHVEISQRHFIELFTSQVGLSPKLFCRLLRFQRAWTLVQQSGSVRCGRVQPEHADCEVDCAQLAVECGYFDQSHLIRDFTDSPARHPRNVADTGALTCYGIISSWHRSIISNTRPASTHTMEIRKREHR
jgi:AraC-like DNA-binding protein